MRAPRDWSVLISLLSLLLPAAAVAGAGGRGAPGPAPRAAPGKVAPTAGKPLQAAPGPGGPAAASPGAVRATQAADLVFGEPIRYHNLTVVPVGTTAKGPFQRYTLLEEGLKRGTLQVRELNGQAGQAQVNQIEVRNTGAQPVYLLGGEMILGGKQDRIIQQDTVLAPGHGWTQVAVFCVERGRWAGQNMQFSSSGALAHASLRSAAMSGSQSAVWAEVARNNVKHGTQSQTETYRRTIQNEELRRKIDPYRRQLVAGFPAQMQVAGLVLAINGEIRVADLFGNPVLFGDLRDTLLSAYILEALGSAERRDAPAVSKAAAQGWLEKARAAKKQEVKGSGRSRNYRLEDDAVIGNETYDPAAGGKVRETFLKK